HIRTIEFAHVRGGPQIGKDDRRIEARTVGAEGSWSKLEVATARYGTKRPAANRKKFRTCAGSRFQADAHARFVGKINLAVKRVLNTGRLAGSAGLRGKTALDSRGTRRSQIDY